MARGATIRKMIPEGYMSTAQLAAKAEVSEDTIRRWRDLGVLSPGHFMMVGQTKVFLYRDEDVEDAKLLKGATGATLWERRRQIDADKGKEVMRLAA